MESTKALIDAITSARDAFLIYAKSAEGHHATKYELANDLRIQAELIDAALAEQGEAPQRYRIEHDGFVGTKIGEYRRRDGKRGVVLQQDGTNIVHVYGEKWLVPVEGEVAQPAADGWRDIKTAPRDGRYVWLWNKHAEHPADAPQRFRWSTHYSVFGLGGCWTDGLCTMGDGIDFDFWCEALPANFSNPHNPASPAIASQEKGSGWEREQLAETLENIALATKTTGGGSE